MPFTLTSFAHMGCTNYTHRHTFTYSCSYVSGPCGKPSRRLTGKEMSSMYRWSDGGVPQLGAQLDPWKNLGNNAFLKENVVITQNQRSAKPCGPCPGWLQLGLWSSILLSPLDLKDRNALSLPAPIPPDGLGGRWMPLFGRAMRHLFHISEFSEVMEKKCISECDMFFRDSEIECKNIHLYSL